MISMYPSINNQDKTIKKSLKSKINDIARKSNISELSYTVHNTETKQYAIVTFQNLTLESQNNSQNLQLKFFIFEDGRFFYDIKDFKKIKDILLDQNTHFQNDTETEDFVNEEIHEVSSKQTQNLKQKTSNSETEEVIMLAQDKSIVNNLNDEENPQSLPKSESFNQNLREQNTKQEIEINLNAENKQNVSIKNQLSIKAQYAEEIISVSINFQNQIPHEKIEDQIDQKEKDTFDVKTEYTKTYYDHYDSNFQIQDCFKQLQSGEFNSQQYSKETKDSFYYEKIKQELYGSQFEQDQQIEETIENNEINQNNQQSIKEYSMKQQKYQYLFEQLQLNKDLPSNFQTIQIGVFKRIKYFDYYLENYIQTIDNADIFSGKYRSRGIIFRILYRAEEDQFQKETSILKEIEIQLMKPMLINCLKFEENNYAFVFFKENYLEIEKILKLMKDKEWSLEEFNSRNQPILDQQQRQKNIQKFKTNQAVIFDKLKEKKYFLNTFIAQGGEGMIFDGNRKNSVYNYEKYAFKIIFDVSKQDIEEELSIMKRFEKNISTIKFYDLIEVSNEILVFILEKCECSLWDQLQKFQNKEIEFTQKRLFQIITSLLDGLIQFRIYKILHLDIKPQNILVNQQENYVFTDFGISSILKDNQKIEVRGCTNFYASNEQILQCEQSDIENTENNIDYLSDVYSLGKTFIEVIKIYKIIKCEGEISVLEKLIQENMLQTRQYDRKDCLSLCQIFYDYFSTTSFKIFLEDYSKQIDFILSLEKYDNNKDIPHFSDILLCYQKINLDIYRNYTLRPETQKIAASLNNIGLIYYNLGQHENALKYMLDALEMKRKVFKGYHPDIAASLNNVGIIYGALGNLKNALKHKLEGLEIMKKVFKQDHPDIARSLNNVGNTYGNLGQYQNALKYKIEGLEMIKKVFKGDHPDITESLNNIGTTYRDLGQHQNALKYNIDALEMMKKLFKGDHPSIAASLGNVGSTYEALGQHQNALKYKIEGLEMRRKVLKGDHPDIAASLSNVGNTYRALGQHENAFKYMLDALKMRRQVFKGDHPDIAESLNNVGSMYRAFGQNQNALKYMLDALEMRRQVFKGDHPEIAGSLNNVGNMYRDLGYFKNALKYMLEGLEMMKKVFKRDHPDIAVSLSNVGMTYGDLGQNENALKYMLDGLEMRRKIFKGDHPDIAASLSNVGVTYGDLGQHENAFKYMLDALEMRRQVFKGDHPDIAESLNNVGSMYSTFGQNQNALKYMLDALEMRRQVFKGDHPEIAGSLNNVGMIYGALGQNENALKYKIEGLEMMKKVFQGDHPSIAASLNNIGNTYRNLGQNKNAFEYLLEALKMMKKVFQGDHPDTVASLNNVGMIYGALGQNENALKYKIEALEMMKKVFQGDHPSIAASLNNVGITYKALGQYEDALQYMLEALEMRRKVFKGYHPDITASLNNVGKTYQAIGQNENALKYQIEAFEMESIQGRSSDNNIDRIS